MKKLLVIISILFMLVGCSLFSTKKVAIDPDEYVIGSKSGTIYMRDGQKILFNKSILTATIKTVRIQSELVHFTVFWTNIDRIEVCNYDKEEDPIKLKGI